jgi:hypothetical protein
MQLEEGVGKDPLKILFKRARAKDCACEKDGPMCDACYSKLTPGELNDIDP